jgi:hypothetical protein
MLDKFAVDLLLRFKFRHTKEIQVIRTAQKKKKNNKIKQNDKRNEDSVSNQSNED